MRRTLRTAALVVSVVLVLGAGLAALGRASRAHRYGDAPFVGSAATFLTHAAMVDVMATDSGEGYWLVGADGGVFTFGDAPFFGSMGAVALQAPVLDAVTTPSGQGYWLVGADGGVFTFGDAPYLGSGRETLHGAPFTAVAATASGQGYWLLLADGGVYTFGDAPFLGSAAGSIGAARAVSIAATPSGQGYWIATDDGGVFTFGDAPFEGSMVGRPMNAPVSRLAPTVGGGGYWLVGTDGGVFCFGAPMYGSAGGTRTNPVLSMAASPQGDGYWLVSSNGGVIAFDRNGTAGDFNPPEVPASAPGATRVGPSNPAALTPVGSELNITRDGAVVENVDVWGPINVNANNVTVRNFRAAQVNIGYYNTGAVLEDGEVHGYFDPNFMGDGVWYRNYTARRLDVHNTYDGLKAGGNVVIEHSWIHDLNARRGEGVGAGGYTHNDGVQISDGSNVWIHDSRFERVGLNAAVFIDSDQGPISNVVVERNYLDGGGITLYSIQSRSAPWFGPPTNVWVRDNVFGPDHQYDYALLGGDARWERNVDLGGAPIDPKRE